MLPKSVAARSANYRRRHPDRVRGSKRTTQTRYRQRKAQWLHDVKYGQPCMDCGGLFDPVCMDFDHRDGSTKHASVSDMKSNAVGVLLAEIAKCDLVCANCHRLRTKKRAQHG